MVACDCCKVKATVLSISLIASLRGIDPALASAGVGPRLIFISTLGKSLEVVVGEFLSTHIGEPPVHGRALC